MWSHADPLTPETSFPVTWSAGWSSSCNTRQAFITPMIDHPTTTGNPGKHFWGWTWHTAAALPLMERNGPSPELITSATAGLWNLGSKIARKPSPISTIRTQVTACNSIIDYTVMLTLLERG
jgi:hypothetical protein